MEISPPLPSTPPGPRVIEEESPTQHKSEAIVVSSDSESEDEEELEGWRGENTGSPVRRRKPKVKHSYSKQSKDGMNNYATLDHATSSPPVPNPPIKVILALTPQPATLTDQAAFDDFGARFSADFSDYCYEELWSCISLYAHYREWARHDAEAEERRATPSVNPGGSENVTATTAATASSSQDDTAEARIGRIHPCVLHSKLEQGTEVHWRFFLPVLQQLIELQVAQGFRLFVIGGFKLGDVAGVKAFAQKVSSLLVDIAKKQESTSKADKSLKYPQIAEPAAILAFLPREAPPVFDPAFIPSQFERKSVMVNIPLPIFLYQIVHKLTCQFVSRTTRSLHRLTLRKPTPWYLQRSTPSAFRASLARSSCST